MRRHLPFLLVLSSLLAACGDEGSYELHWNLTCTSGEPAACPIRTAQDCAEAGFDAVEVVVVRPGSRSRSVFPCFSPGEGAVARGPGLASGPVTLEVSGLSPGGQSLSGPVSVAADIPGSGLVQVEATLPRPAACADGVDNDRDGLVDLLDPGCESTADTTE